MASAATALVFVVLINATPADNMFSGLHGSNPTSKYGAYRSAAWII
jgi:hypothetical protein